MITMTLAEFHTAIQQRFSSREDVSFICPMCKCVQSARDLITAGAGPDFDSVEKYLGFSCVGRWTGAGSPRKNPDGKPCDWTLGGLFSCHEFEVVTPDQKSHPRFALATKEEAESRLASTSIAETLIAKIQMAIRGRQLSLGDEKKLQAELSDAFNAHSIIFDREVNLDKANIVDFMIGGLAVEIKIRTKASAMQIYRQLERYCAFPEVKSLLLMTSKAMSLPPSINGKPVYVLSLSRTQV